MRLLDLGLDPINFADALVGVLAQRLARTLCKDCKEPYVISDVEAESIRLHYGEDASKALQIAGGKTTLHKPKGCKECGGTGYKGRIGVHELLVATPKLKNLISRRANVTELRDAAVSEGMTTLMQDGILKILDGLTDLDQIKKVTA